MKSEIFFRQKVILTLLLLQFYHKMTLESLCSGTDFFIINFEISFLLRMEFLYTLFPNNSK